MQKTVNICVRSAGSRYVALDLKKQDKVIAEGRTATAVGVRKETQALWERNRLRCGWFVRSDFVPETRDDLLRCLHLMAQHGDRNTFVLARKLEKCL